MRDQVRIYKSSTLLERLADPRAASPRERTDMVRLFLGRVMSSVLVQIQVEAYMLTLGDVRREFLI